MHEMPRVETHLMPSAQPPGGVGEVGVPPLAPAVVNALAGAHRAAGAAAADQAEDLQA
jgi:CO/xanthine dehydrogenase Mo-binding subunit